MRHLVLSIMSILGICFIPIALALPEDSLQPVMFQADFVEISQATHKGSYRGHVELDQGSTHLRAARAITMGNDKHPLVQAIVYGDHRERAHYWSLLSADKPPLHAYADSLSFFPETNYIELIGHATIVQGNHTFNAPFIRYDIRHQQLLSKNTANARTTIIIHPEKRTVALNDQKISHDHQHEVLPWEHP